ncbi:hypothetical protein [Sandaracinus amylolyticus]|uniref:Uncharacterized protein n=1 Tax=Sandaracinus amylolyticus TaxID=927083 RepID=A0A0F6WA28_9BACT|nr:hypothetical protein [Sandaracinus amylolyticus]AKF11255.1 Hypothetical protein DB32_008404 [Sandaracinus amylolyticus]
MSPPQQWGGGGGGFGPPQGGGGFGPPQGGGGFGPPGGGGGGFGPPGGGGGFGPPGGGTPPPGGGGYGGGGDAPLTRIPFTPEDEKNIQQTALFMKIAGGLAILGSLFSMVGSIGVGLYRQMPIGANVCVGVIGLGVQALLAVLLFMAASAFEKITTSDGQDQQLLADGLGKLRVYFLVKAVLWVLGIVLCCCGFVLVMTMGAAIFAALGASLANQ